MKKQKWKSRVLAIAIATVMILNSSTMTLSSVFAADNTHSGAPPGTTETAKKESPHISLDDITLPSVGENPHEIELSIDAYPIYNEEGFNYVSGGWLSSINVLTNYEAWRRRIDNQSPYYTAAITPWFSYIAYPHTDPEADGLSSSLPYNEGNGEMLHSELTLNNDTLTFHFVNNVAHGIEESFKEPLSDYMQKAHGINKDQVYVRIGATILSGIGSIKVLCADEWFTVYGSADKNNKLVLDVPISKFNDLSQCWIDCESNAGDGVITDIYVTLIDNQAPTLQSATLNMEIDEDTDTSSLVVDMQFNEGLRFVSDRVGGEFDNLWIELELVDLDNEEKSHARLYLAELDKNGRMVFKGNIGRFHYKNFRVSRISKVSLANRNREVQRGFVDLADEFYVGAYNKIDYDNRIILEQMGSRLSHSIFTTTAIIDHAGNGINEGSIVNWQFGDQRYISNSIEASEVRLFNEITLKKNEALEAGGKVEASVTDMFVGPSRSLTAHVYLKEKLTDAEAATLYIKFNINDENGEPLTVRATSWGEYKVDELYSHGVTTGTLVKFENVKLDEKMSFAEGGDGMTVKILGMYDDIPGKTAYPYLPDPVTDIYADFDTPRVTLEKFASYSNTEPSEDSAEIGEHYKVSVKIGVKDADHLERFSNVIGNKLFVELAAGVEKDTKVRYLLSNDPSSPENISGYTSEGTLSKNGYIKVGSDTLINNYTEIYLHLLFESKGILVEDLLINAHVEDAVGNRADIDPSGMIDYLVDGIAPDVSYSYRTASAIDGNTKIELKVGVSATDTNDIVQLLYSWGDNPDREGADPILQWIPLVIERGSGVSGEITTVFGNELPESNTVYEEALWVKAIDEYGNESEPILMPVVLSLEKPSVNMRFEGDYNAVSRDHSVTVTGADRSSGGDVAYTRVSITPIVAGNQSAVVSYVTLVKTGDEVNVMDFTGLTWYKVTRVGDTYVSVSGPETIGEDYVLTKDSIMYDLFTYYGEIKISLEGGYGDMTPVQGDKVYDSAIDGSYLEDPNYLTLRFASPYDTDRVIHSVDFGAIIDRDDNTVVENADRGAEPYRYNADTKGVNPMRNTQIHFNLSNIAKNDYGMLDLDFEGSYAELYRVGLDGEADVLISKKIGLAASDSQYFTIFNTSDDGEYFVSGAYYLKVTAKSRGGHLDSYESSRIVLDAETGETSGLWQYSTQNYSSLESILNEQYSWSTFHAEDQPFDNIGVSVATGGEILRNRMFASYTYGVTGLSVILRAPNSEKTYEGITVGKVAGFRIWNLLSEPTEEEIEAAGFRKDSSGDYLSAINGLSEIYTEENIPKGSAGFDTMYLVKGVNTICYQIMMENGYVSPIRQFNITVSEYTPELNIAIESYQPSFKQSENKSVLNVDHIRYFIESAYSLNGSGNVDVEVWSDYGMYVGIDSGEGTVRSFAPDPTEQHLGLLGLLEVPGGKLKVGDYVELTENSYTADFPRYTELCTAVFVARDEYGGVTIVAPQIGANRRIEVRGDVYGWESYNIDYYGSYYDDPYLIDDGFLSWRGIYNQPLYFGSQFLGFESYVERNSETGGERYREITDGDASLEYNLFNIETNDIHWGSSSKSNGYYEFGNAYYRPYSYVGYDGGRNYELIYWDGATITFSGGDLGGASVTLDLKSGNEILAIETGNGIERHEIPNIVGYLGADVYVDNYGETRFSLSVAHPSASPENPAGTAVERQYVIRCQSKYGDTYEISGEIALYYIDYALLVEIGNYGAELELSFMSREYGNLYRTGRFNAGEYSFTATDYYGNTVQLPYTLAESFDNTTKITVSEFQNTPMPVNVTLTKDDGASIFVDITDHGIMSVEGNGTPSVTVTLIDNTDFSFRYIDTYTGEEISKTISVDNIKRPAPKIVWSYDEKTVLEDEDGTLYKYGEVTAYLVDENYTLIDKFSGKTPSFTFIPNGQLGYVFKGEEIKAVMGDYEVEINGDFFARLAIKLYELPDPLGLDVEDTETPNVQVFAYYNQNGYYTNTKLALRLEAARDTSNLTKHSSYQNYEFVGDRANAARLLEQMGWGTAFRFEIQTEDRSRVKMFIKEGLYAAPPDYETGTSDSIPGVNLNSKLLTVTQNAAFSLFVVDARNNSVSIAFEINNIGEAPIPKVIKVEKRFGIVRGYIIPPDEASGFEIIGGQNVKIDADSPTDSAYFGKYYVEYSENDDYVVNYRFNYNGKAIEGALPVSITEISLDEIALVDNNQPIWSENKAHEATPLDVTATATFTKEIKEIKVAGEYDEDKVSFFIASNTLTAVFSDNHGAIEIYCYDAAGNHVTVRFDAVENIDRSAPVIEEVGRVLSENGRSLTVTFSSNERALFREGGYIGEAVTLEDGTTLYYYTRTIVQNGTYSYSFVDMSGIITVFKITVDEIVSEPLEVRYSTSFDGTDPVIDPSALSVMIGDKVFIKPNRAATVQMSGGGARELNPDEWNEITIPDSVGGTLPYVIITDEYGNVLTHQFLSVRVPDTTSPEIIVNRKTYSVKVGVTREQIEAELLSNFVAFDDAGGEVALSVKFTDRIDTVGITEVEYTATDSAGNSTTVTEKLRITSIYEPEVTCKDVKIYRGEGAKVALDEELVLGINSNGAPYMVKIKSGNMTEAQMKDGGTVVASYTTENSISFGKLERGLYTVCIITQERDYFKIIISVE